MCEKFTEKQTDLTYQTGDMFRCWLGIRKLSSQRGCDMYGASTTNGTANEKK